MKSNKPKETKLCSKCRVSLPQNKYAKSVWVKKNPGYCLDCRKAYDAERSKRLWEEYTQSQEYQTILAQRSEEAERKYQERLELNREITRARKAEKAALKAEILSMKAEVLPPLKAKATEQKRVRREFNRCATGIGLDPDEMWALYQAHNGLCEICGVAELSEEHRTRLCMDHCHTTGRFRGWLCHSCNRGLGLFKDDLERITKAANYLS